MLVYPMSVMSMETIVKKEEKEKWFIETIKNDEMHKNFIMHKGGQISFVTYSICTNEVNKKILDIDYIETKLAWREKGLAKKLVESLYGVAAEQGCQKIKAQFKYDETVYKFFHTLEFELAEFNPKGNRMVRMFVRISEID